MESSHKLIAIAMLLIFLAFVTVIIADMDIISMDNDTIDNMTDLVDLSQSSINMIRDEIIPLTNPVRSDMMRSNTNIIQECNISHEICIILGAFERVPNSRGAEWLLEFNAYNYWTQDYDRQKSVFQRGDIITIRNMDISTHNIQSTQGSASINTGDLNTDQSHNFTLHTKGEIIITCVYHPWMRAMIEVV